MELDSHAINGSRNAGIPRKKWSPAEDKLLKTLVRKYGTSNWRLISNHIRGREGKQCRERWLNHLSPDVKKGRLTDEEWAIVLRAHQTIGNRWSDIAKMLPGRTPNQIKNYWHSSQRSELEETLSGQLTRLVPSLPSGPVPGAIIAPRFRDQAEQRGMKRGRDGGAEGGPTKRTRGGMVKFEEDDLEEEDDEDQEDQEDQDDDDAEVGEEDEEDLNLSELEAAPPLQGSATNTEEREDEDVVLESPMLTPSKSPAAPFSSISTSATFLPPMPVASAVSTAPTVVMGRAPLAFSFAPASFSPANFNALSALAAELYEAEFA